ncbi:MAG TPA: phosphohistidine phosphatase SixA [Vicinamibacterales bacterium]|nr:phosphohistidine phosphatase SixA [Vicinamibacterales bacterium]HPW19955.1 phosphohistidine phosphatase SixA [Vicinamibacterales bacterium]
MTDCSLYLVRHGAAAEHGPSYPNDDLRPLTGEGIERLRLEAAGLAALDVRLDRILTSPLVRAVQTAEVLAAGVRCAAPLVTAEALRPGGRFEALVAELAHTRSARSVALVGHLPSIGQFAAALIGATRALPFDTGGVCRIDVASLPPAAGAGRLVWHAPPRALRALGR